MTAANSQNTNCALANDIDAILTLRNMMKPSGANMTTHISGVPKMALKNAGVLATT